MGKDNSEDEEQDDDEQANEKNPVIEALAEKLDDDTLQLQFLFLNRCDL